MIFSSLGFLLDSSPVSILALKSSKGLPQQAVLEYKCSSLFLFAGDGGMLFSSHGWPCDGLV